MQNGNDPWTRTHKVNLVTDAGGGRSAGSAFKAFTLATALMQGISPDATYNGNSPKTIPDCGGTGATWTVHNAEPGGGTYTLRSGDVGVGERRLRAGDQPGRPGERRRDGAEDGHHQQHGARVLPADARRRRPRIEPAGDGVRLRDAGERRRALHPVLDLEDRRAGRDDAVQAASPVPPGHPRRRGVPGDAASWKASSPSARRAARGFPAGPAAGKTGTGENNTDAWFVGYVPQLATAVWVGYASEQQPVARVQRLRGGARRAHLASVHGRGPLRVAGQTVPVRPAAGGQDTRRSRTWSARPRRPRRPS